MNTAKPKPARSFAEEAAVYWLVVSVILLGFLSVSVALASGPFYLAFTLALAIVELVLACECWNLERWGFLASTVSAIVLAGLAFGILYSPIGDLLLLLQLQVAFFAYSAYRKRKE